MTKPLIITDPGLAALPFIQVTTSAKSHASLFPFGHECGGGESRINRQCHNRLHRKRKTAAMRPGWKLASSLR